MKRAIWLILFAVLVFAGIVIAGLPASWVMPGPKSGVTCADVDGTIWNGTCTGLIAQQQPIGDLSWEVHASRLLAGKLNAALVLTRPSGTASGTVELGLDNNITARNVHADLPLDPALMPQLPPNLHGSVHADIALVRVEGHTIRALQGRVEARDLLDGVGKSAQPLGSYSLTFPAATSDDPTGQLRDLGGGPLEVEGTLRLTPEPGFELQTLVKTRATAPQELANDILFLGSPDARGFRPFSMTATF